MRKKTICTSSLLVWELASQKQVVVEASIVRRHLNEAGYYWRRRGKQRKYIREQKIERKAFVAVLPRLLARNISRENGVSTL